MYSGRAGVVRHQQRAAVGGDVLDSLLLDPEPVAVVEVQCGLDELEDTLGAAPVVHLAALLLARNQVAQEPRLGNGLVILRGAGDLERIGARVE
jgi:hypothetical protein